MGIIFLYISYRIALQKSCKNIQIIDIPMFFRNIIGFFRVILMKGWQPAYCALKNRG